MEGRIEFTLSQFESPDFISVKECNTLIHATTKLVHHYEHIHTAYHHQQQFCVVFALHLTEAFISTAPERTESILNSR